MSDTTQSTSENPAVEQGTPGAAAVAGGPTAPPELFSASTEAGVLPELNVGEAVDVLAAMQQLRAEADAAKDRELRALAELDNFRKRANRQLDEERKYASLNLIRELLSVVDNLERAMKAAEQTSSAASLLDGVKLVTQQLQRTFEQHHCTRIVALGTPFDPAVHQAIGQQPSAEYPVGAVMQEVQVGYQMHERVLRPALVLVSTGPAAPEQPSA